MSANDFTEERAVGPKRSKFRVLAIDGGGIRGVIPAKLLAELEALLAARPGSPALIDCFQLVAGTSTGGLIALALAAPGREDRGPLTAADLVRIYTGPEGKAIFERPAARALPLLGNAIDLVRPKYSLGPLRAELERQLGPAKMSEARTDLLITAYDMAGREPHFFRRWTPEARTTSMVDAGLATAAAPTYFPPHRLGDEALVDGGVFAANPTIAGIFEAMKRTKKPDRVTHDDLLVLSLGTGHFQIGYEAGAVEGWGALDWILPQGKQPLSGEPPLIGTMLDGQTDSAHDWAHTLLNHHPGSPVAGATRMGRGARYYRYEAVLREPLPMDDASEPNINRLLGYADSLIEEHAEELNALADALAAPPAEDS